MGWENCHLHDFVVKKQRYAAPDPDDDDGTLGDRRRPGIGVKRKICQSTALGHLCWGWTAHVAALAVGKS